MRVTLSTVSKFYTFDIARQMLRFGVLERLFTGRPRWKMRGEDLPTDRVSTFPLFQTLYEGVDRLGLPSYPFESQLNWLCHRTLDSYVKRHMPQTDIFHALAYCGLESGLCAQRTGAKWVCDSPTPHLAYEHDLVDEECSRLGVRYRRPDDRFREYAQSSYEKADAITVSSTFARQSFVKRGLPPAKLTVIPYGVDLARFRPVQLARPAGFHVLFVGQLSVRKGLHDLVEACKRAALPNLTLTLVGSRTAHTETLLSRCVGLNVRMVGPQPSAALPRFYSAADVMVLPSISDAFGLVIAEALACGCPVIASDHTGGRDVLSEGVDGFLVPIRAPEAIADRLVWLHDHAQERLAMRSAAIERVRRVGGWDQYGDRLFTLFGELAGTVVQHGARHEASTGGPRTGSRPGSSEPGERHRIDV
jgi:alpha-maltose-1-phosphate synthase